MTTARNISVSDFLWFLSIRTAIYSLIRQFYIACISLLGLPYPDTEKGLKYLVLLLRNGTEGKSALNENFKTVFIRTMHMLSNIKTPRTNLNYYPLLYLKKDVTKHLLL